MHRRPSETKKSYPVDIAVFDDESKHDDKLLMVVECKAPNVKTGRKQLEIYLSMCEARIGVWFNGNTEDGNSHLYLKKDYVEGGGIVFTEIPSLPRRGQRIEDIGRNFKRDLIISEQLKTVLRDIRNHLAGMLTSITRDEEIARQIINILFCKVYDETEKGPDDLLDFRAGIGESSDVIKQRLLDLFGMVKDGFPDVFLETETISFDADSLAYVVGELQPYSVTGSKRDVVGDAFEVFIGPALRGDAGQFFTPRNVVRMMVEVVDPEPDEDIIDPACGSGGFLIAVLDHVWGKIESKGKKKKWTSQQIRDEQKRVASRYFRGIDKDSFLAKVTKAYMAILGDGRGGVFCDNSLFPPKRWNALLQTKVKLKSFNVVLTNPPFGTKIQIEGSDILGQYTLGHKSKLDKATKQYNWTEKILEKQPPQLLFIERCIQLLKPGGRLGIVIPESILGMPTYTDIVQYLRSKVRIVGVVSMPEELFQPHTHAKTAVVFIKNVPPSDKDAIFMSVVEWCGHDSRGNPTIRLHADGSKELLDDTVRVADAFKKLVKNFK